MNKSCKQLLFINIWAKTAATTESINTFVECTMYNDLRLLAGEEFRVLTFPDKSDSDPEVVEIFTDLCNRGKNIGSRRMR